MSTYTIKWGDTLSGIARDNNTDVDTLMALNPYITNPNKIYSGNELELPDPEPIQPIQQTPVQTVQAQVQTSTPVQSSTQELAENYAKQQTANVAGENQALLDKYAQIAENQKQALALQKENTANQINQQRDTVMQNYHNNARQAYINSMLGKKQVEQQLSQAGLNTSGLVGSAYANVANAYGNNLANLQINKDNSIRDIEKQLVNSDKEYAIQEQKLLADIGEKEADLMKYNNQLAYQKWQDAINNYMTFTNFDYNKYIDERDFNYNKSIADRAYEYQKERDAIEDEWREREYELALKKASSSGRSSGGYYSSSIIDDGFEDSYNQNSEAYSNYETMVNTIANDLNTIYKNNSDNFKQQAIDIVGNKLYSAVANGELADWEAEKLFSRLGG